jgi:hypothetical protein
MIEVKGARFINPQHLKQEIADIVMGELTAATYDSTKKKHLAQFFSQETNWAPADSDEVCAALMLAHSIAEELIVQYILIEPTGDLREED